MEGGADGPIPRRNLLAMHVIGSMRTDDEVALRLRKEGADCIELNKTGLADFLEWEVACFETTTSLKS